MQNILHFPNAQSALENGMEQIVENGIPLLVVDGLLVEKQGSEPVVAKFGIVISQLGRYSDRGKGAAIAQFYSLVGPGLIVAKHIFRGLNRPLFAKGNMKADVDKSIYSWKPRSDYEWKGGPNGGPEKKTPPDGLVFVTIISPNNDSSFPSVAGWVEHWNWVHESGDLNGAPVDWGARYREKLWSAP